MTTHIAEPWFLEVEDWRRIVKNNAAIHGVNFLLVTDETWLPHALTQAGFFPSGSRVKQNRPDLWRDVDDVRFELGWCSVKVLAPSNR